MTTREIADPEVLALARISGMMQVEYDAENLVWEGSPFAWIKRCSSSRRRGTVGERLVAGWLAAKDFDVVRSPDSDADRLINGHRAEVKFSTLWQSGEYTFQQLRDQNYEYGIWLGVSPFDAHCWIVPKAEIMRRWRARDGIVSQHGGAAGRDTGWLKFRASAPPRWLNEFGGQLSRASGLIERYLRRESESAPPGG